MYGDIVHMYRNNEAVYVYNMTMYMYIVRMFCTFLTLEGQTVIVKVRFMGRYIIHVLNC